MIGCICEVIAYRPTGLGQVVGLPRLLFVYAIELFVSPLIGIIVNWLRVSWLMSSTPTAVASPQQSASILSDSEGEYIVVKCGSVEGKLYL